MKIFKHENYFIKKNVEIEYFDLVDKQNLQLL